MTLLPSLIAPLFLLVPVAAGQAQAGAQGEVSPARPQANSPAAVTAFLLKVLDAEYRENHWTSKGAPEGQTTAQVILAFHGEGQTLGSGDHRVQVRGGTQWLARSAQAMAKDPGTSELELALCFHALADASTMNRSTIMGSKARIVRGAALSRRGNDGLWGEGPTRVPATVAMVLGAAALPKGAIGTADTTFVPTWGALDGLADPKTGLIQGSKDSSDADRLRDTSAVLTAKLVMGLRPETDKVLALQIATLSERLADTKAHADSLDANFWLWTSLAAYQLDPELGGAWRRASYPSIGKIVDGMRPKDEGHWPVGRVATVIQALGAPYRYARFLGDD